MLIGITAHKKKLIPFFKDYSIKSIDRKFEIAKQNNAQNCFARFDTMFVATVCLLTTFLIKESAVLNVAL